MAVLEQSLEIPYGVVEVEHERLTAITEKPIKQFFINAGIYTFNPEAVDLVPPDGPFDMPSLFERIMAAELGAAAFPVYESWIDIGHPQDLERAQALLMKGQV